MNGAAETLKTHSPIVLFEICHAGKIEWGLISSWRVLGYSCYRLIPALNLLVPAKAEGPRGQTSMAALHAPIDHALMADPFLLNL